MYELILFLLLPAALARLFDDYNMLDPFLTGDALVKKILAGRLFPTRVLHLATKHLDTTMDAPTIYVDDRRTTLLSTEKQIEEDTGITHQIPTRSQKYITTDTAFVKITEREFAFFGNPSSKDQRSIVFTKGAERRSDMIDTDVTVYEEARHVFPEQLHGLSPLPTRIPEANSVVGRDWYAALRNAELDGQEGFPEPVFRLLTRQSSTHSDTKAPGTWKKILYTTTTTKRTRRRIKKKTTTSTTPTSTISPCIDEMGYRVRCTNSTSSTKTRTTTTTTTPTTTIITTTEISTTEGSSTSTEPTTPTLSDIEKLLSILDNLTYIYETGGLLEKFNKTLLEEGYPYCQSTASTPSTTTTTEMTWKVDNFTGTVTNKCYVCGLDSEGIPRDSNCADAFAGDFFPMAPVDFTARRYLEQYKKQCRYLDMPKWHVNGTRGRSMWGKWTGGCAVRWLDISGAYTQRTCRNRFRPTLGKHFASKRMAKLEYALFREDNGCIISPQASLVPFSRGISLYARFHACVCTGNYCNRADRVSTLFTWLLVGFCLIMVYFSNDCMLECS